MAKYSHSGLESYEQCPLKFKFRYIDGLKEGEGIEGFLGQRVHETIHHIYTKAIEGQVLTLKQAISYYEELWKKKYNKEIRIVKKHFSSENYFNQGLEMIKSYYEKNYPFKENILGMEQRVYVDLNRDGCYLLVGVIDKLIYDKEKDVYEVHDYKTSSWLPDQEELDNDRQLALYSLAVKELYPKSKKIILKWHFLKHGKTMTSIRTDKELKELKEKIVALIDKIKVEENWPAKKSQLCNWCGFNEICPEYKKLL